MFLWLYIQLHKILITINCVYKFEIALKCTLVMLVPRKIHRYIIRINVKVSVSKISKIVSFDLDYLFLVKYLSAAFHSRFT
jgi:hypothetical protein